MKSLRSSVLSLAGLVVLSLAIPVQAVNPSIRIMPVGDSITDGSPVPGGYRAPLYVALTNAGYNVDYVGTQTVNPAPAVMPDPDHEGHSGWTIGGIDGGILGWFNLIADPDVILLHIGTNDASNDPSYSNAVTRLDALITKMATARPLAHIIVTSLMKRSGSAYDGITNYFNPYVPGVVSAQAALGRRVTFLDMHAYLELTDMADGLHPNQTGYNKMAAAWFPAITNVISPAGDLTPPSLSRAAGNSDHQHVAVTFSKPLDAASATSTANYAIDNGLTVSGATLSADLRTVTLATSTQTAGTVYTVTVNNVADLTTPTPLVIAANSTVTFSGVRQRGYLNNVPESSAYKLVYTLDLPNSADYLNNAVAYSADNSFFNETFSRVAYYMELQTPGGELQYLWASMDAFTNREDKLGVPTAASGAIYQQYVTNMNIFCNVPGVTTGAVINTGNLEFWPSNYSPTNTAGIPGANDNTYDFGDRRDNGGRHGSMQLHNFGALQTLFAVNNWGGDGGNLGIGIGNCPSPVNGGVDWTFAGNSANYTVKTLQVLVLTGAPVPPTLTSVQPNPNRTLVDITFGKTLDAASATTIANYAINNGVTVTGASLSANLRTVTLTTSTQVAGTLYTVTVNNVADLNAPTPLTIAPNSQITFVALTTRGYLNNVPESSNYTLVYSLDIPAALGYYANQPAYSVDNSANPGLGSFSRVAYYMELQKPGADIQYVWVSMDAFTNRADKLGVPTRQTGAVYQRYVSNMNVFCNVPGVVNGTGIATGNLEFWPYNYNGNNAMNVPNANGSFDFGDTCDYVWDYGSMQVHNYGARQTLFAFNHWGPGWATPCLGIGNQPSGDPDWTFNENANSYTVRSLQVLVLRADSVPPVPVSAQAGFARTLVTVTFSEPLAATSVDYTRFTLDHGVQVQGATLQPDLVTVYLTTTGQPSGVPLTLTINGIRDISANLVPAGTTIAVSGPALPPEIVSNVGTNSGQLAEGYQMVYTLDIPVKGNFNSATADPYRVNQSVLPGAFDRVAYYVELQKTDGTVQYLWASMDAFATDKTKIAVPIAALGTMYQQYVNNLTVTSNVSGVQSGINMAGGNLEFWPSGYITDNEKGIPGASGTTFDFGDGGASAWAGYGSMQIHNSAASQTLFAMNDWGNDGNTLDLGIGNQPGGNPDWTFAGNAGSAYTRRLLHILTRPSAPPTQPPLPPEVAANVPGAAGYTLAYTIDLPVNGSFNSTPTAYTSVNNTTNGLWTAFSRVAYYLELQSGGAPTQFIWTAMDAFTADSGKIGVPVADTGTFFQQRVDHLDVLSNVGGIVNGTDLATGNIEFWPSNYGGQNDIGIPNASADLFDFGDGGAGTGNGYGSMQVHNYGAAQTLFAINNFNNNNTLCIGIGNRPGTADTDWTFSNNAGSYNFRRLHVFVLPAAYGDLARPTILNATASRSLNQVAVVFSEKVSDSAATPSFFALNNGMLVNAATLLADKKTVVLTTTALTAGQAYTLAVTGARDRSPNANVIRPGSTAAFTAPPAALPPVLANVPEASGYALVYQLAIPNPVNFVPNGAPYTIDESKFPQAAFDRLAYCMELVTTGGASNWVYVSMDAFTADIAKIGVPTAARGAVFQQYVNNLNIYAPAGSTVTTGTVATGNIEFWPSDYGGNNDRGIPGATSNFDFGDSGGNTSAGHGSMQVHNYLAGQTIFAMNAFGSNGRTPALGIGNKPGDPNSDWTFAGNAGDYSVRNLYVLAHWSNAVTGTPPEIWSQPQSLRIRSGQSALFNVYSPTGTAYQWRHNGSPIAGATRSWLELNPADMADGGTYDVLVYGSGTAYATSRSATLSVLPLGTLLKLR